MLTKAALRKHLEDLGPHEETRYFPCSKPSTWRAFRALAKDGFLVLVGDWSYPHFRLA